MFRILEIINSVFLQLASIWKLLIFLFLFFFFKQFFSSYYEALYLLAGLLIYYQRKIQVREFHLTLFIANENKLLIADLGVEKQRQSVELTLWETPFLPIPSFPSPCFAASYTQSL